MSEESLSPADMAVMMNNGGGMNGMWNNPFMYLIWLAIFGNGGFGGFGNNAATQSALTRAELTDGLNNQNVQNDLRSISTAIDGTGNTIQSTGAGLSQQMCSGFSNSNMNTTQTGNGIVSAINSAASAQQLANCGLSHSINDLKYEMANNTSAITNAVHSEGEETRKTLIEQEIQNLRDSREETQRELQSAQLALANANQTQNILGTLGRFVPYSGCGSNCGCSSW